MYKDQKLADSVKIAIEVAIRLGFLFVLLAWCFQIAYPFTSVLMWGVILAMATSPAYNSINDKLGDKPKISAAIIIIGCLAIILIPSSLFIDSLIDGTKEFKNHLDRNTISVPPPNKSVADWPLIGQKVYDTWKLASTNLEVLFSKYNEQISEFASKLIGGVLSVGGSLFQFVLATIICGILLATRGTGQVAKQFFRKLVGEKGDEITEITEKTVRNVTKGVLGVAVIQAMLVGIGFLLAGVPYAGIWTLLVMILAILQMPPMLVIIPVIIYLFSKETTLTASLWTVYLVLAGASDNFLKPILLGKGAPVPMIVIFIGVLGGFMLSGFIGLFTGAIVFSLGYKLFLTWLQSDNK